MKAWIRALAIAASVTAVGRIAAEGPAAKATLAEKDAFVLFELSYADVGYAKDATIRTSGKEGNRSLTYDGHVLSCGTHMNGSLRESTKGSVLSVKGSFAITENPYSITTLEVDLSRKKTGGAWTGYLVVDGKRVPVELVQ